MIVVAIDEWSVAHTVPPVTNASTKIQENINLKSNLYGSKLFYACCITKCK